jgi:hypothetical protein
MPWARFNHQSLLLSARERYAHMPSGADLHLDRFEGDFGFALGHAHYGARALKVDEGNYP